MTRDFHYSLVEVGVEGLVVAFNRLDAVESESLEHGGARSLDLLLEEGVQIFLVDAVREQSKIVGHVDEFLGELSKCEGFRVLELLGHPRLEQGFFLFCVFQIFLQNLEFLLRIRPQLLQVSFQRGPLLQNLALEFFESLDLLFPESVDLLLEVGGGALEEGLEPLGEGGEGPARGEQFGDQHKLNEVINLYWIMNRLSLLKLPRRDKRSSKFATLQKDSASTRSISRDPDLPKLLPPSHSSISARAWLVMDLASRQIIDGKETDASLEIASLTKIMTFLVCMKLIQRLRLNYLRVSISRNAVSAIGTSARLVQGTWLTIHDLLYGLLLPSGNDAAVVLAQTFGLLIDYQSRNSRFPAKIKELQKAQSIDMAMYERQKSIFRLIELFVREMNSLALEMQLSNSKFNNPTGLADQENQYVPLQDSSSAQDVAKISAKALQQKKFQEIVNTRSYVGRVYQSESPSGEGETCRSVVWRNTNVLLERGYRGVKTGITKSAGGCLSSLVQAGGAWYIIVVLGSQHNQIQRFKDTQYIRQLVLG